MTLDYLILAGSIALLLWSTNVMLDGAVAIAHRMRISALAIGILLGLGTSAPEFAVSTLAAVNGNPRLGVGNALGSNIANIGLVLGFAAAVSAIGIRKQTALINFLVLGAATALLGLLMSDLHLGRVDGAILVPALIPILIFLARTLPKDMPEQQSEAAVPVRTAYLSAGGGLLLLLLASHWIVESAVTIARALEIDEIVIGLSVIAIGTSLPELATTVVSVWKKHHGVAVGNILGSNLFNSLGVVGVAVLIQPAAITEATVWRDFGAGAALTLLLLILLLAKPSLQLTRWKAAILLVCFCAYLWELYRSELLVAT